LHPWANQAEMAQIEAGGALVAIEQQKPAGGDTSFRQVLSDLRQLLSNRMLVGIYIGQYCITTLTYFFITWFPPYLVQARGMSIFKASFVASLPAICGFIGGVLGGVISDFLLRRGYSLTVARKTPIVAGMLLSMVMIACNYIDTDWIIVAVMALAYFGKGVGALGWAVVSDTSPKQISGLNGSLFNMFGNTAAITTPIVIGYIVKGTGSFDGALIFIGANALVAVFCYLVIVGEIKRAEIVRR
jgi:MFS transporter, ACS family, glucarate transporter